MSEIKATIQVANQVNGNIGLGVDYYKGTGIDYIDVNADNSLTIHYTDGTDETTNPLTVSGSVDWNSVLNKPFNEIGDNLKIVNGKLSVDTTVLMEEDNTKPITSGGVYVVVGNINALLEAI